MPIADILGVPHAYDLFPLQSSEPTAEATSHETSDNALVFIHGWLLSKAYWQPLVSQLSTQYACMTYDMRGFGASVQAPVSINDQRANDQRANDQRADNRDIDSSERRRIPLPPGKDWYPNDIGPDAPYEASIYSLAAYAQDLGALLDHLQLENVWLMGHSLGGSVALWAAYLFPDRVRGVVCLNAGGGVYIPKEFEKFRAAGRQMVKYRPAWLPGVPLLPRVFTRAMVHRTLDIRWGQQRLNDFVCAERAAAEGALLESTTCQEVHQLPKLVGQLHQPAHFITATQDSIMLPRYVNYLASFHPQFDQAAMVSEIPECGHMAMVEQPDAVAAVVRRVLGE